MPSRIVPVLGMHRSGTSAVAGALHNGGIPMGLERHFRPVPHPENPKGFYEDHRFRRINDLICEHNGYRIKSWVAPPTVLNDSVPLLARRIALLLGSARRFPYWGWKDPRTCLTFDLWAATLRVMGRLDQVHAVLVFRDPRAVGKSLRARNGLTLERTLDLWYDYNRRALRSLRASGVPTTFVDYSRLVRDPAPTLRALAAHLPRLDSVAGVEFIDARLERFTPDADSPSEVGDRHPALDLFETLRTRAA